MERQTRRDRLRRILRVLVVVVGIVVVVAGSVGWHRWSGRARVLTTDSGLHVVVGERASSSMTAAFDAEITRVGRCLGLGGSSTIWPHGTRVVEGDRIRVSGRTYAIGDRFRGGGGFVEAADPDREVPRGCSATRELLVVSEAGR